MKITYFRILLPYGLERNPKTDEWTIFNREYAPLGMREKDYEKQPVYFKCPGLTDAFIRELVKDVPDAYFTVDGKIQKFWLYDDKTNPIDTNEYPQSYFLWEAYLRKVRMLSEILIEFI